MKTEHNRLISIILSVVMIVTLVLGSPGIGTIHADAAAQTYRIDFTSLSSSGIADKAAVSAGTTFDGDYFKTVGTVTYRVDDGKDTVKCVEVGKAQTGAIQFYTYSTSTVKFGAASTGGKNTSLVGLLNVTTGELVLEDREKPASSSTDAVPSSNLSVAGTERQEFSFSNLPAGTYQIVSPESTYNRGARVFDVTVEESDGDARPARADWSTVTAPVIDSVTAENGKITVNYTGSVGHDSADKITVQLLDTNGAVVEESSVAKDGAGSSVSFTPSASGTYTVKALAIRNSKTDKKESVASSVSFVLPLSAPVISSGTSMGGGSALIVWGAVAEADSYLVSYKESEDAEAKTITTTSTEATISGLTAGKTYSFTVTAVRDGEQSAASEAKDVEITAEAKNIWSFTSFGTNTTDDTTYNGYSGDLNADGSVSVWNLDTKGKLVPKSTDGISFYYTAIPADKNFTFSADVSIDTWTLTNGQEGFGIMAADAVSNSHTSFWNNSYMASVTKVGYTGSQGEITMKLGVGAQEKIGVPAGFDAADGTPKSFTSTMNTLDDSCKDKAAGTYNIVGNYTNDVDLGTVEQRTSFHLAIKRDNTGYTLTYSDPSTGNVYGSYRYYDVERDNLCTIDTENIYVGFFASRSCKATFSNVSLESHDASQDPAAEERPIEYVDLTTKVLSASKTGNTDHTLQFYANADGVLTIKDKDGNVLGQQNYTAATYAEQQVTLTESENKFTFAFTPDADYRPDGVSYKRLRSYDTVAFEHTVTYETLAEGTVSLYVAPNGTASGKGTKVSPLDIYTAISYVQAGQTIVLAGGTYNLEKPVTIERGVDGTADKMIYMVADPDSTQRPVFDFGSISAGFSIAGNYWYIQGLDVTNTAEGNRGILVAGNHCTLDQVNAYGNRNTGIQISRYLETDERSMWPSYNLILNCTSYNNADKGYEDADGFAAKLTCGEGNVFDGCIAYNNADDGWDLYAKVETGSIGAVTIQNCVAYHNGYLLDGTNAGNGNGFKMGGESQYAGHHLINSIAYENKAKGIDSNSCPDNKVTNSTSFNNEGYNVALYTNVAKYTAYEPNGILSFRVETDINEQLKPVSQENSEIYKSTNYYWFDGSSKNTEGTAVSADWFVSLDTKNITPTRNADGTINMHGLLELTAAAPADAGARLSGKASTVFSVPNYPIEIESNVEVGQNAPVTILNGALDELAQKILTEEEQKNGGDVKISLKVTNIDDTISEEEKALVEDKAGDDTVAMYFDISLFKKINNNEPVEVTSTNGAISITIQVSGAETDSDAPASHNYQIIRVHDGSAEVFASEYDAGKITFESDKFSTYALVVRKDGNKDDSDNNNGDSNNNGSDNNGSDNNGSDNNGSDNNGSDNNGSDNNGSDNNGSDNNGSDNNGSTNNGNNNSNGANNGTNNSQSAGTGDSNPIALWIGLLVIACVLVGALIYLRKKNK